VTGRQGRRRRKLLDILYIFSTNIHTEFLNMLHTLLFFSSKCSLFHNVLVPVLFTFNIQGVLKFKCQRVKERIRCSHLKGEALDHTMWRAHFGRGFRPVVRQTTK
jgi:hypothetical protein